MNTPTPAEQAEQSRTAQGLPMHATSGQCDDIVLIINAANHAAPSAPTPADHPNGTRS